MYLQNKGRSEEESSASQIWKRPNIVIVIIIYIYIYLVIHT